MTDHSILPPSSAFRRMLCPGSRALEKLYPQSSNRHSIEGQIAHHVAALAVTERLMKPGEMTPLGVVDSDMVEGAKLYAHTINLAKSHPGHSVHVETKIDIKSIHDECWGTCDAWYYSNKRLYVWDYKYGHKIVEPEGNWQLIAYAAGILDILFLEPIQEVNLVIVQPRGYTANSLVRTWRTTINELQPYFDRLRLSEAEAMKENAPLTPSAKACEWCNARMHCPALQKKTSEPIQPLQETLEITNEKLSVNLKEINERIALLTSLQTILSAIAVERIVAGQSVPGFFLESGRGSQVWKSSPEEVIQIGQLFGCELQKPIDVITPKQAIKAGIPTEVVTKHSELMPGALKLKEFT
jgi:Protein of unknown function (DUF2800)